MNDRARDVIGRLLEQDTGELRGPCECIEETGGNRDGCWHCGWSPEEQVYLGWIPADLWRELESLVVADPTAARTPCDACNGQGSINVSRLGDTPMLDYWETVSCPRCDGGG